MKDSQKEITCIPTGICSVKCRLSAMISARKKSCQLGELLFFWKRESQFLCHKILRSQSVWINFTDSAWVMRNICVWQDRRKLWSQFNLASMKFCSQTLNTIIWNKPCKTKLMPCRMKCVILILTRNVLKTSNFNYGCQ